MAAPARVDIGSLICMDPDIRGGRPCIAGTGMSVHAVALRYSTWGMSVDDIIAETPGIPSSHIVAAVAYYLANKAEIDRELAEDAMEDDRVYEEETRGRSSGATS
jgi:uncharacterized protein (DUF433 family)